MGHATRRHLVNLGLALASTAVVLGLLEVLARVERRSRGGGREDNALAHYSEPDPVLGWRKRPGARATYRRREYTVDVMINSQGLRDRERSYEATPGIVRILALGDSFVEGYSVPLEATVTQVLEASLSRPACPVEVINGGTSGYSTDQEYLFYREEGARYSPRIVLLFLYYNDVVLNTTDSYYGRPKPRLVYREGRLEGANLPLPSPSPRAARDEASPRPPPRWAFLDWVRERVQRGAPRVYNALASLGLWPRMGDEPLLEMRVYKKGPTPRIDGAWQETSFVLEGLAREVASHGARLLVLHVPNRMEVSDRDRELTRMAYGMDDAGWDPRLVLTRLERIGRTVGFPVLDLTPALRGAQGPLGGPYYTYDPHWNALGHRVAAEAIAGFLRSQGWLSGCSVQER